MLLCSTSKAQQAEYVDFKTAEAEIYVDLDKKEIRGSIIYTFNILKKIDSIVIDSKDIVIGYRAINGVEQGVLHNDDIKNNGIFKGNFRPSLQNTLKINFHVKPKKALYFVEKNSDYQVWTQGQGKYTSHWLPSIDDVNDKIIFDLSITTKNDYTVLANGKLIGKDIGETTTKWHYNMQKPMSSYLVALVIGKYKKKELTSKSNIPLELYYYPEDSAKVEPTYRYTKQLFDFFEKEIGVPYPWQNYKQAPVKDFLYSGMENTSLTIFSDDFMIDEISFVDKNYVNVNAHELAHQWFGDFVTATEGTHHWLQEGFATYYALLAEREIFGDDYYYNTLYNYAKELIAQEAAKKATALLNPKASSLTFYKKGAWALHVLREKVGEQAFKTAVVNYLNAHAYKNVETKDFISEAEKASGMDLSSFENQWLVSKTLPIATMRATLKKNKSIAFLETINQVNDLNDEADNHGYESSNLITELPKGYYSQKLAVLNQVLKKPDYPTYKKLLEAAFSSEDIKVRQLLARVIPDGFKIQNESLLADPSYITKELALMNLWSKFPQDRAKYLDATKEVIGFNNKNIRCLWLTLALLTRDYDLELNSVYIKELTDYTSSKYGFQVRQNAFSYLKNLQIFDYKSLANLVEATRHHNWRFKSYAKDLLKSLSEEEKYKEIIINLQEELKTE